ncbi:hypothetical protein CTI12_AA173260 [Artemisia annua]|uniref:DUF4218 domain-containing protein n=1 Tax=Artemisia annua TaxID=35608 RepID=A0A2U1PAW1_ARTAN|nr:hypothetical protein CTI12_AA173260 [Artemisia annua]
MVKAKDQMINILCRLEQIYPPAFFDIMIHLVMHLPEEALQGGPVSFWWMYPFERYMKKLKNYVRNKAKPEGSIAEDYVANEALTFCSRYFRGEIGTKFNRPNASQGCPRPTSDFQVFRSLCKKSGKETIIRLGLPEMKKVIWYVLHNSPEIDTYMNEFQSEHPESDMQQEFPRWFESKIGNLYTTNDPRCTPDLFALACGPSSTATSINSCVVNGVKFVFKAVLFRVKWFDLAKRGRVERYNTRNNMTQICSCSTAFEDQPYILATQAKQVFYLEDPARRPLHWKVVQEVNHNTTWDVIVVEDDDDVIHGNNSSNLQLSTNLNALELSPLNIDGQSTLVEAPPPIITVDEDDDFIDDEDDDPYDLADSDPNNSDDEIEVATDVVYDSDVDMAAAVARGHGGDGASDPPSPPRHTNSGCRGGGSGGRQPRRGGRARGGGGRGGGWAGGMPQIRQANKNVALRKAVDKSGPQSIEFEMTDQETYNHVRPNRAWYNNYVGELVRSLPLHYPSWHDLDAATRAAFMNRLGVRILRLGVPQAQARMGIYSEQPEPAYSSDNKGSMKKAYFTLKGGPGAVDVVRQNLPPNVEPSVWEEHMKFYMNDKTLKRVAVNKENRKKNKVYSRYGSKSLAAIRHDYRMNSKDKQYPSLIQSFYDTHCDEDVEEMVRLRDLGANTPDGVAYTEEQILAMVLKGKQRGHIAGRGRVVPSLRRPPLPCTPPPPPGMADISAELATAQKKIAEDAEERKTMKKKLDLLMGFASSNPMWSQYISQVDSQHVDGSGSGAGGSGSGAGGSGSGAGGSGSDDIEDLDGDDDHDDHDEEWDPQCRRRLSTTMLFPTGHRRRHAPVDMSTGVYNPVDMTTAKPQKSRRGSCQMY